MARIKRSIVQRDFSAGQLRQDFLERDDIEMRAKSLKEATNVRILATGAVEGRPGTFYMRAGETARQAVEIEPVDGQTFALFIYDDRLRVLGSDGLQVYGNTTVNWTSGDAVCVIPNGAQTFLLSATQGIFVLEYNGTSWAYGDFVFDAGPGGSLLQPYWKFERTAQIKPSNTTGSITITADLPVFKAGYVGTRIRYAGKEILITGYTNTTTLTGDVQDVLPPTYAITVASTVGFRIGDVVIGQDSGFQGVVVAKIAPVLYVLTLENEAGPKATENLSGPTVTTTVTSFTVTTPDFSSYWDEQLISSMRGFPRSGAVAAGRLFLTDFASVPNLICASSVRAVTDFEAGAQDDDAILRTFGGADLRARYIINAGDLMILTDSGLYYVNLRDGSILTPLNFAPVLFDGRGVANVAPVLVDGGVVFIQQGKKQICAALLDGNIYLKWSVKELAVYHSDLVTGVQSLCGPPQAPSDPERYLFAINGDGTAAVVSWRQDFGQEAIGFVKWTTEGQWKFVAPLFGGYWTVAQRNVGGSDALFIERFSSGAYLDCAVTANPNSASAADHLVGETVNVYWQRWNGGTGIVNPDGSVAGMEDVTGTDAQIGFNFVSTLVPWPAELTDSARLGTLDVRIFELFASVQSTGTFQMRCNAYTREVGGYAVGDDVSAAPPLRTAIYRAPVYGTRTHPDLAIIKHLPTPWRVLAIGQEVQG